MFEELLKGKRNCPCGKEHVCAVKTIVVEAGAIDRTAELLGGYARPLVVCDRNTEVFARRVLRQLSVPRLLLLGEEEILPDEHFSSIVEDAVRDAGVIVGVGSGVINDLCKFVSHKLRLPYAIVATAPSMDGYASTAAAMITNSLKVTYFTHVPEIIIADTDILKEAPLPMIQAGFGDILGKYSALNDWKLSALINREYFCAHIYAMMEEALRRVVATAEKLLSRDEDCIRELTSALILSGIAMAFADNSRPASGSEHHIAHFFEVVGLLNGKGSLFHGTDVAYATLITARLRESALLMRPNPGSASFDHVAWESEIRRVYGTAADGIISLQAKAGWHERDLTGRIHECWEEIASLLREHPSSEDIARLFALTGLDFNEYVAFYGEALIGDAICYAKDLKDRYTLLRLLDDLGAEA